MISDNLEIISCPAGKKPDKIRHNKKGSIATTWYTTTCADCPFSSSCPTKECKAGRSIRYKRKVIKIHFRRVYEESLEFKDAYRYRSGIEATNSRFIHMTSARRSRYRELPKMKFSQKFKALAINVFRLTRYLTKLAKKVVKFIFLGKRCEIFFMRGSNFEFAT